MKEFPFLIYAVEDSDITVNVIVKDETIWLSQKGMAELFGCSSDNISLHLKNIFSEGEFPRYNLLNFRIQFHYINLFPCIFLLHIGRNRKIIAIIRNLIIFFRGRIAKRFSYREILGNCQRRQKLPYSVLFA